MFAAVYAAEGTPSHVLMEVARDFSPRVEACGSREVTLDLSGLTRLFGDARTIAAELRRTAADRGLRVRVAIAGTRTAARLLVHHRAGVTIVEPGDEAAALANTATLELLARRPVKNANRERSEARKRGRRSRTRIRRSIPDHDLSITLGRWGLRRLAIWLALPPTRWRAAWGRRAWTGSASRAARIGRPLCRRCRKNGSSRRSISNGRSRVSSRCRSCSAV